MVHPHGYSLFILNSNLEEGWCNLKYSLERKSACLIGSGIRCLPRSEYKIIHLCLIPRHVGNQGNSSLEGETRTNGDKNWIFALETCFHCSAQNSTFLSYKRQLMSNFVNIFEAVFQPLCCLSSLPIQPKIFNEMQVLGNSNSW